MGKRNKSDLALSLGHLPPIPAPAPKRQLSSETEDAMGVCWRKMRLLTPSPTTSPRELGPDLTYHVRSE